MQCICLLWLKIQIKTALTVFFLKHVSSAWGWPRCLLPRLKSLIYVGRTKYNFFGISCGIGRPADFESFIHITVIYCLKFKFLSITRPNKFMLLVWYIYNLSSFLQVNFWDFVYKRDVWIYTFLCSLYFFGHFPIENFWEVIARNSGCWDGRINVALQDNVQTSANEVNLKKNRPVWKDIIENQGEWWTFNRALMDTTIDQFDLSDFLIYSCKFDEYHLVWHEYFWLIVGFYFSLGQIMIHIFCHGSSNVSVVKKIKMRCFLVS